MVNTPSAVMRSFSPTSAIVDPECTVKLFRWLACGGTSPQDLNQSACKTYFLMHVTERFERVSWLLREDAHEPTTPYSNHSDTQPMPCNTGMHAGL